MAQDNPIYTFLKENGYTQKSEEDFLTEYSDKGKAAELHNFMQKNSFTTKEFDPFYDEYLKKKEVSSPEQGSTSQTFTEPLDTSQENRLKGYVDVEASLRAAQELNPNMEVQPEPKKGFLSDIYNSLAAGSAELGASFAAIPKLLYNIAAIPQNLAADISGIDALRSDYESVSQGDVNPLKVLSDIDKYYRGVSESHLAEVTQFEGGITESLSSGNFIDAGRQIATSIAQSAPSILGMVVTSGAGQAANFSALGRNAFSALPFAASNLQEIKDNEDIPESLKPVVAGLRGLSEVVFEQSFGTTKLIEQIGLKTIGKEGVKEFVEGYMSRALNSTGIPAAAFRGSVSEAATELSNNIIDKYSGVDPDRDLWQGVADAAIVGGVLDVGISNSGSISSKIIDRNKKTRAKELETQLQSLKTDLDGASSEAAPLIQNTIDNKTEEFNTLIDESVTESESIPQETKQEIQDIDVRIDEINSISENQELGEGTIAALQEEASELENQRQALTENRAPRTQEFFSTVVEGADAKFQPSKPYEIEVQLNEPQQQFEQVYAEQRGNFDEHIATSIPRFRETQIQKGTAISEVLKSKPNARILDIGGSEGGFVKAITQTSGATSVNLEPNPSMAESHRRTPVEGSEVIQEAFYEGFEDVPAYTPAEKFDVVHESMVFQFITPERSQFVNEVADKYLTEDGLFVTEEKLKTSDPQLYAENEAFKDENHKSQYYDQQQLRTKGEEVLVGMDENQASIEQYVGELKKKFKHVYLYWNSGNFYGIAASNSEQTINTFKENIGDTDSPYSYLNQGEIEASPTELVKEETPTTNIFKVLGQGQEAIKRRKAQVRQELLDTLQGRAQSGINPEAITKLVEYAVYEIADGTITTAKALHEAIKGFNVTEKESNRIFNEAKVIAEEYSKTTPSPQAVQQSKGKALVTSQERSTQKRSKNISKKAIREVTQGGQKGSQTITNRRGLAEQIRTLNRGIKEGRLQLKEARKDIKALIRDMQEQGLFQGKVRASTVKNIINRINDASTPTQVENALEYLQKASEVIDFDKKVEQATAQANRLKRLIKGPTFKRQTTVGPLIKRVADLAKTPGKIQDIDTYLELLNNVLDNTGTIGVTNVALQEYLDKHQARQDKIRKDETLSYIQDLLDEAGIEGKALDYYTDDLAYDYSEPISTMPKEGKSKIHEQLEEVVTANREFLQKSNPDGVNEKGNKLNSREKAVAEALENISLEGMEVSDLKQLNTAITNAIVNKDYTTGTSNILGAYKAKIESDSWIKEFSDNLKTIRVATSKKWNTLAPNPRKVDTNQLFRNLAPARDVGQKLYGYVMGEVNQGYIRAKKFIDLKVEKAIDVYDKNKMTSENSFAVGAAQYLLNFETDGRWNSREEAFQTKLSMVRETLELLKSNVKQRESNLTRAERRGLEKQIKDLGKVMDRIGEKPTLESVQESFLDKGEQELYDLIIDTWAETSEPSQIHFQKMGVKFTESDLYAPISYNTLEVSNVRRESEEFGVSQFHQPGATDSEGNFVNERQNVKTLPKRRAANGTEIKMYLNLDAIRNFDRELKRRTVDIETIDARIKAKHVLANNNIKEALNRGEELSNHEAIVEKVELNIRDLNGISGFLKNYDHGLDVVIREATKLFYRGAVGSMTQAVNQSLTNVPSIIANTSLKTWTRATYLQNTQADLVSQLIYNADASAYNRLYDTADQKMQNTLGDMESEIETSMKRGLTKVNERVGEILYSGLQWGDNANTKNSWLSGYIQSLVKQGIIKDGTQFTKEMLESHIAKPNKEAQQYADGIASSINATMKAASRAESVKNRSTAERIMNMLIGNPLKSFATSQNMEARIAVRNIMSNHGTTRDVAIVGAYMANILLLHKLLSYIWSTGFQITGQAISGLVIGEDDREKAEERRLKELNLTKEEEKKIKIQRRIISMAAQAAGDMLLGSSPIWIEQGVEAGVDLAYTKLIVANFNKTKTAEERARNVLPNTLYYTSSDNVFGVGVLDQFADIFNTIDKLVTSPLPIDEAARKKIIALRAANTIGQTGIIGADAKRFLQQATFDLEKVLKDGYYKMSNSYGLIKDVVNAYDIKPIAPFNERKLFLSDDSGNTKAVELTENEILELNREIGFKMVELLKTYKDYEDDKTFKYGRTKETFNKNNVSIEEINKDMAYLKKEATSQVIFNKYKKYKVTEKKFDAINAGDFETE